MRIALAALGSRGDTQPTVALAEGLAARGHDVKVLASDRYAGLLAAAGIAHSAVSFDPQAIVESEAGQALLRSGPIGFVRGMRRVLEPLAERTLTEIDTACADVDLVLAPALGGCGRHVAERHGIPHAILQFQPSEPTRAFANPLIGRRNLGGLGNRASFTAIELLTWAALTPMTNRLRASVFGLEALRRSTFHLDRRDAVPVLCGVSPAVVARPSDWPASVHLTGFWLRPPRTGLDADLEAFLGAGPAPVYLGFGSMAPADPEESSHAVRTALGRTGLRGVVQGLPSWSTGPGEAAYFVDEVEHASLFPRTAAVVHHGGAGTTATGLRAGVPSVVCPFFGDQPFWAARVTALGVGPDPAPIKALTAELLVERLRRVTDSRALRTRAADLGRVLRAEDGVGNACRVIENQFGHLRRRVLT